MQVIVVAVAGFVTALVATWWVRRFALSRGLIDNPNARSSHTVPTPRGGGLAIVVAVIGATLALAAFDFIDRQLAVAVLAGGLPIAIVGLIDDRRSVPPLIRFVVQIAAAATILIQLGGIPPLQFGRQIVDLGLVGGVVGTIAIVWIINLFNFMDGIDGIAASEATFVFWIGALLLLLERSSSSVPPAGFVYGCACCGFLVWNWPPARIFMGDVGSGFLGCVIATLALAAMRDSPSAIWVWLILGGVFFTDATTTLIRRLLLGERIYEAHRNHAYQQLARRWRSHLRVTSASMAVNLCWLWPLAFVASKHPHWAHWIALGALLPLAGIAVILGAGRPDGGPRG